jgi:hypothetical protein
MAETMRKLDTMLQVGRTFGVRDGILRLGYELQRGSGLMSWRMRSVQRWDSWALDRIAPGIDAETIRATRRDGTPQFFFSDARSLAPAIREMLTPEGEASVLAEAENILTGNLPFFGALTFASGFPPRWFHNPATSQSVSPQQPWTQMRFASPIHGDLKFILESSRFLFVYPLVRAYALSGDERFSEAFWTALEDWARQSPPMAGPLWICAQECSLRILAWSFALHAFIRSNSTTTERVELLTSMIAAHAWRIAQTLGYARSQRSNHLITEAVGLWTAGTLYPELREAQVWRNLGAHLLREAVLDHMTPEGVSQQYSFNYQRMILHLLLWTLRLAELHDAPLHDDIRERAELASDFMREWVDATGGGAPNYGSDDGSLIFPLSQTSYRDFRPLVRLSAAVLKRPALDPGPWDEAAIWFGSTPAPPSKAPLPAPCDGAGFFRLGDQTSWALIRAGHFTRRPFQCDQLHVDLWWNGVNIARDPGTYLYNGPAPWNNGFARTAVHNTVTVDGQDQMRRAGRFLWVDWAQASGRVYASGNGTAANCFAGEHDGYKHLGVMHRRKVQWLPHCGWVIVDDLDGSGQHDLRLHWLAPDLPHRVFDVPFEVMFKGEKSSIRWNIFCSADGSSKVIRAGKPTQSMTSRHALAVEETQLQGWESLTYGDLRPAVSLVYETQSKLPVRFATVVLTNESCAAERKNNHIVVWQNECEVFRIAVVPTSQTTESRNRDLTTA